MKKPINLLGFHKISFKFFKLVHKNENSMLPLCLLDALVNAIYPFVNFILSAKIIDSIISKNYNDTLLYIITVIALNVVIKFIIAFIKRNKDLLVYKVEMKLEALIRKHALVLDFKTLENSDVLEQLNTAEFALVKQGGFSRLLENYIKIVKTFFTVIVSLVFIIEFCLCKIGTSKYIINNPIFCIITILAFIILNVYIQIRFNKSINDKNYKLYDNYMVAERRFVYFTYNIVHNIEYGKISRLFNMHKLITNEFEKYNKKSIDEVYKYYIKYQEQQMNIMALSGGISILFAYMFVILKVILKAVSIGDMTKYVGIIANFNDSLLELMKSNEEIRYTCKYIEKYLEYLDIKGEMNTGSIPIEKRNDNEYKLEFHNVSFKYDGSDDLVLDNINCKLTLKNKMAVVGPNGAGKTTFIKLLSRLYDPTKGYITLNGVDIRKYDYEEYLSLFGVVFQDFSLFALPVNQNVSSSINSNSEKVWKCLELAGAKEKVESMSDKLNTPLYGYDDEGVNISGGEAQKIAISRALYKDAPFVILDEPTSALDPISEYEIYSKFDKLVEDKTSIYISHRMSSCRFCDDIIVFDKGKIVQRDNHDNLVKQEGLYKELWDSQAKYYVKA